MSKTEETVNYDDVEVPEEDNSLTEEEVKEITAEVDLLDINAESDDKVVAFEDLLVKPEIDKNAPFGTHNVVKADNGGLKCTDKDQVARQKSTVVHLVKQMGSNIMEGKSLINVSLPVKIFEPRSFLQRIADVWCYIPIHLTMAARAKDPVERMKWVVTFGIAGLHHGGRQLKPFNPILGETFQARYPDGSQLFCEQVSHHPPISAFSVVGPNDAWHFHGHHEYQASFRPNGLLCGQVGPTMVDFPDGGRISWTMPRVRVNGLVFGDRTFTYYDSIQFIDKKNKLRCEITFDPDAVTGLKSFVVSAKTPSDTLRGVLEHGTKGQLCDVTGSWLEDLRFGKDVYWHINQYKRYHAVGLQGKRVLPSDCRLRSDLIALSKGDAALAQKEKEKLENAQRYDRKLRSEHEKKVKADEKQAAKDAKEAAREANGEGGKKGILSGVWPFG